MSKRTSLSAAIAVKETATVQTAAERGNEVYTGSAVNLRKSDWRLLRKVAEARADIRGGRPSVSKVLESLIDSNRKALESEIV